MSRSGLLTIIVIAFFVCPLSAHAQRGAVPLADNQPAVNVEFDGLVPATRLALLDGAPMSVKLKSGLLIRDATLESLQFDPRSRGLKFIKYRLDNG